MEIGYKHSLLEELMGQDNQGPVYTGMDKYPGILATIITIVIGAAFIGALFVNAASHH